MNAERSNKDKALLEAMWPTDGTNAASERDTFVEGFDRGWDAAMNDTYADLGVRPIHILLKLSNDENVSVTEAEILAAIKKAEKRVGRVA